MSILSEVSRLQTAKTNLKSGLNNILPDGHKIANETIDQYPSFLEHVEAGSGGGGGGTTTIDVNINGSSAIICAELPNVTLTLKNSLDVVLDTKNTGSTGGIATFSVSANGTYTIVATDSNSNTLWTNTVVVDGVGTYNCKTGKPLDDYTWAEINTASTGGYAKYMWSVEDEKTFTQTGSILNNYVAMIIGFGHDVLASDGTSKAGITFMFKKYYSSSGYNIMPKIYLNGTSTYKNAGGYRASVMRQRFQASGESCYSQASGITAELLASGLTYADGTHCPLYSYTESTDTFVLATSETFSTSKVYFVAGYYKSVGTIKESAFVAGKYFTYSSSGYAIPDAWDSGATYYCLYPTLQENGVFYNALSDIVQYFKTVQKTQSCGNATSYNCTTNEKIFMLCAEEIWGVNKTIKSFQNSTMTGAGFYNTEGEGTIYDYFKNNFNFGKIASASSTWWTRSPATNYANAWNYVSISGSINVNGVNYATYVRPCFCI